MAMGLLGALLPDMSCSLRMCGEWRGGGAGAEPPTGPMFVGPVGGAGAEPPTGPMFVGGDGGKCPATAWTVL